MKNLFVPILLFSSILLSCSVEELQDSADGTPSTPTVQEAPEYQAGVLNVKFTPEFTGEMEKNFSDGFDVTKAGGLAGTLRAYGVTHMERLFPYAGEYEERTRKEGLHRWYKVIYDSSESPTKAGAAFASFEGVEIAEPERRVVLNDIPFNDPKAASQWHYFNDGKLSTEHSAGCDVNVVPVWDKYTKGDPSVIVAVVDHGIDLNHEDLKYNYVGGFNYYDGSATLSPGDHGTHVAGTIAATNNNHIGVCGIAGGDYAKKKRGVGLYSCQVFSGENSGGFPAAIKGGADHGAVISQNSWGYDYSSHPNPYKTAKADRPSKALVEAINYFVKYAGCDNTGNQKPDSPMKGGVVIFSAGNNSWDASCICEYCDVVAVGALGPNYERAPYSNYGDWVDIAAPGGDLSIGGGGVLSTVVGDKYAFYQGTSMACPHVSGVAALIISACGGQGFTNEDLKKLLIGGANYSYGPKGCMAINKIGPLVDALGAIESGNANPPRKVSAYSASAKANIINFDFKVTGTDDSTPITATSYLLLASRDRAAIEGITDFSKIPSTVEYGVAYTDGKEIGDDITGSVEVETFDAMYYVAVVGCNRSVYSSPSSIKTVKTGTNTPPVIDTDYDGDFRFKAHETLSIPFFISDPDGHTVSIGFESDYPETTEGTVVSWSKDAATGVFTATFNGTLSVAGKYNIKITASDGYSDTEFSQEYEFLENHAPQKVKDLERVFLADEFSSKTLTISDCIVDPDGEAPVWSCVSDNPTIAVANPKNGAITVSALAPGMTVITVTGTDVRGLSASLSFPVLVYNVKNPVNIPSTLDAKSDMLSFSVGGENPEDVYVRITSSTGKTVFEDTFNVSGFDSINIPFGLCAPGVYTVYIKSPSVEYTKSFVRL